MKSVKERAPRNRTLSIDLDEREALKQKILTPEDGGKRPIINHIVKGEFTKILPHIKDRSINLLILDPPYNLTKRFNNFEFTRTSVADYTQYLDDLFKCWRSKLTDTASIYICGDWLSSASIYEAAATHFKVRNRITWEREKGRGAARNWKNCSEDIWFCTLSDDYYFDAESVRTRRIVRAPYKKDGKPKDWKASSEGNFRDTAPSNLMADITIPFWSMSENTDHPTQKSEKLIAKLMLASSRPGDLVCDPFSGSGTTAVVAKKLGRDFIACDIDLEFCLFAQKRLALADEDTSIQGYEDGVFWERNSANKLKSRGTPPACSD